MDSIIPILIGLAVIILQAVSASNKKKEEARRRAAAPPRPQPYMPSPQAERPANPFEEWVKSLTANETDKMDEINEADETEEAEATAIPEQALYPKQNAPSVEAQLAVSTLAPAADSFPQSAPPPDAPSPDADWHTDSFDLKKAVIYSEILRRKY
ncbi:MAG: hypothetical protein LBS12_03245 [Prevotellaceae bacterium]|jgi:hypothetical protein|nr:hypothetical protein [Prevotellaceae bacterium]